LPGPSAVPAHWPPQQSPAEVQVSPATRHPSSNAQLAVPPSFEMHARPQQSPFILQA
jgi:hypothetical protein